jgi:hypothetical protein
MPKVAPTHIAYVLKRETRTTGRWLEIGSGRIDLDGNSGAHHIFIDRLPVGGFGGHILLQPVGIRPPDPNSVPERPGEEEI